MHSYRGKKKKKKKKQTKTKQTNPKTFSSICSVKEAAAKAACNNTANMDCLAICSSSYVPRAFSSNLCTWVSMFASVCVSARSRAREHMYM